MTIRFKTLLPVAAFAVAADSYAVSLDERVNGLLAIDFSRPCADLLDAGAQLSGELENDICFRVAPVGATPNSSGGGSANPVAFTSISEDKSLTEEDSIIKDMGKWSVFLTGEAGILERDATDTEGAYEVDTRALVFGASYAPTTTATFSVSLNFNNQEGDFDNGGAFSIDSAGIRALGAIKPTDVSYLQFALIYDDVDSERLRNVDFFDVFNGAEFNRRTATPLTEYSYDQIGFSARYGYEFSKGAFTISPEIGLDYLNSDYGTYTEQGSSGFELTFHDDEVESLQSNIGALMTYAMTTSFGAFIPQANIVWRHEFEADARDINFSFVDDLAGVQFDYQTDELDADFFEVSVGGVVVLANGIQAFADVKTLVGHEFFDSVVLNGGIRVEL